MPALLLRRGEASDTIHWVDEVIFGFTVSLGGQVLPQAAVVHAPSPTPGHLEDLEQEIRRGCLVRPGQGPLRRSNRYQKSRTKVCLPTLLCFRMIQCDLYRGRIIYTTSA